MQLLLSGQFALVPYLLLMIYPEVSQALFVLGGFACDMSWNVGFDAGCK
jgi:hypothetical protein